MLHYFSTLSFCVFLSAALVGCGDEIGDACNRSTDCSNTGDRICDVTSPGGYCTVLGCDIDTCPEESVCVRFFASAQNNRSCEPSTEDRTTDDCRFDEFCTLSGLCALSNAEVRYCMKVCDSDSDCRDDYECRDLELMKVNGGEPLPTEDDVRGEAVQNFCATSPI